jgi:hypothetical protein
MMVLLIVFGLCCFCAGHPIWGLLVLFLAAGVGEFCSGYGRRW